ncbi:transmembrane and immunoglobulin domain-containing protein 1-like [Salmo trutta]|uniref:transmembrane and immunoglobulin domain-containing protein 1-like n=1 Tax=Salmo trutta TaxID=8032 RepID=UPI001131E911|nr:transmembrane and immunoglobulin domain-containing protein 1-like [Salmo trutta]
MDKEEDKGLIVQGQELQVNLGEGNRVNVSSLCVQDVSQADHQVTFTCQLKRDPSLKASVMLIVHYLSGTDNVTVEEFSDMVLSCPIYANPPVTVSWLLDGRP